MDTALETARRCRHYAMCKIDFLGTGLCPAALENFYVSYYPQGRMDLYADLAGGRLELTPGLSEVAESCVQCGRCDLQCHFVTQMRPSRVAYALKALVEERAGNERPLPVPSDPFLESLRRIVGRRWATNDPAHLAAYSDDPCPLSERTVPRYVVLPSSADEMAETVRLCLENDMDHTVRGNGSSVMGFVLTGGLVIDTARMRLMEFDEGNWCVRVGAGISSHELQTEAWKRGFMVNAAEPAALYCANLICSGIFSLFSSSMGTAADNILDASFISPEGGLFRMSEAGAPNFFAFSREEQPAPGICTEATVRLHPVTGDESGLAVPFDDFRDALQYAGELNRRGIGLGIGMMGMEYLSTFISPTSSQADALRRILPENLGMEYLVLVLGDRYALGSAADMAPAVLSQEVMRCLILGMPSLEGEGIMDILEDIEGEGPPYTLLCRPGMLPVLEAVLDPSPAGLASVIEEEDLRKFYEEVYGRPEMTDLFMLNVFRTVSSRMGRDGHVVAFIVYVPLDDPGTVRELDSAFAGVAEACGVRGAFGFITPLDRGRMGVLEWDMYLDHADPEEAARMRTAMAAAAAMLEDFTERHPRFLWIRYVFNRGFSRKESFLYHRACGK